MSVLDSLASLGTVVIVGGIAYEVIRNQSAIGSALQGLGQSSGGSGGSTPAGTIGQNVGTAVGDAATGAVVGTANSIWSGGHDTCWFIQQWRNAGSPNASFLGINVPFSGGGDPLDWSSFSRWMQISNQIDPGPTPPACWVGTPPAPTGYAPNS